MNITILEQKIIELRGTKVLVDSDMASLYGVELATVKAALEQHKNRFPNDFAFALTPEEASQHGHPESAWAFTEHGVTMLSCLLPSERAVHMSVEVVRAFINLRRNAVNYLKINARFDEGQTKPGAVDVQLHLVYDTIEKLLDRSAAKKQWEERERIGFRKG
jgi:hypothetical protein